MKKALLAGAAVLAIVQAAHADEFLFESSRWLVWRQEVGGGACGMTTMLRTTASQAKFGVVAENDAADHDHYLAIYTEDDVNLRPSHYLTFQVDNNPPVTIDYPDYYTDTELTGWVHFAFIQELQSGRTLHVLTKLGTRTFPLDGGDAAVKAFQNCIQSIPPTSKRGLPAPLNPTSDN